MKVVRNRRIVDDAWHLVADDETAGSHAIVSLARWNAETPTLVAAGEPIGVLLRSNESPDDVAERDRAALIAVDFPSFTDGRGYTTSRMLRSRHGYKGEIRAVGDVMRDEMFLMSRCGIDSFAVKASKDIEKALSAFDDFSVTYQAAADDERPLFRRASRGR
ncbi:MAG TPA: DUF934 domain-containing protein [Candidatus Limnocylindrales bacterium]|nr:DUF934 domain-containing protein [Candidatus Limnocylindrales bacterium]